MLDILETFNPFYIPYYLIKFFLYDLSDPRSKSLYFMNPFSPFIIVAAYLYFIYVFGPAYMERKPPYDMYCIMSCYDLLQIFACSSIVVAASRTISFSSWRCKEVKYDVNGDLEYDVSLLYHYVKILDLGETAFYILRKREFQLTGIHIYHHASMVICSWGIVKYSPGGQMLYIIFLNSFLHIFIFLHYFLIITNKEFKKSNFTVYNTCIQFVQFIIVLVLSTIPLLNPNCHFPWGVLTFSIALTISILILSAMFLLKDE